MQWYRADPVKVAQFEKQIVIDASHPKPPSGAAYAQLPLAMNVIGLDGYPAGSLVQQHGLLANEQSAQAVEGLQQEQRCYAADGHVHLQVRVYQLVLGIPDWHALGAQV